MKANSNNSAITDRMVRLNLHRKILHISSSSSGRVCRGNACMMQNYLSVPVLQRVAIEKCLVRCKLLSSDWCATWMRYEAINNRKWFHPWKTQLYLIMLSGSLSRDLIHFTVRLRKILEHNPSMQAIYLTNCAKAEWNFTVWASPVCSLDCSWRRQPFLIRNWHCLKKV